MITAKFPPGRYYIGDLCYATEAAGFDWREYCDLVISDNECREGVFILPDGRPFFTGDTAWGDGCYASDCFKDFDVDSGSLGLIEVRDNVEHIGGGHIVNFPTEFIASVNGGVFCFGHIRIDTTGDTDET